MNIKPGDLFEWVYENDNSSVDKGVELYSYTMSKWVPCSGLCLCVGVSVNIIHWVSDNGLFRTWTATRLLCRDVEGRLTHTPAISRKVEL